MMKRRQILAAVLFTWFSLVISFGLAQAEETGKSFTWEIETVGGKSYILGSVHALKKEHYPLKQAIERAFTNSTVLVVEANISEGKIMEAAELAMKKGSYGENETLKDNLSEKTYNLAKQRLLEKGLDIDNFSKIKPWMLALTITSMEIMQLGFDPNYGIDKYFMDRAAGKKEILELEGAAFQVNLLDGLSPDESDKFLFITLQETEDYQAELDKMVAAWKNGDAEMMERLVNKSMQDLPGMEGLFKKMNDDRNVQMLDKILTFFKEKKSCLIVVGAAHLVGEKGLLQMLKNKGFILKQL
ncbi:MAG: TraB/GumN family protein [Candidatus Aminicenantes bacterium]|nr:TraB/GumN family protein [Candidatus Aminicenantes bacterium]